MEYREIRDSPEDRVVDVVWGERSQKPEYGIALRLGSQWYIKGQSNPHANGRPCAAPDGWLPQDRKEWTRAERRLINILALHPELKDEGREK